MKPFIILGALVIASMWSCVSSGPGPVRDGGGGVPSDCVASSNIAIGAPVESVDAGTIILDPGPMPEGFDDPVVVSTEKEYFLKGRIKKASFELVYSGVSRAGSGVSGASIESKAILGKATREVILLSARSKSIDPYLIACTSAMPVFEGGYWYFVPGMYIPTEMKWLSYEPASAEEFRSMYDHAVEGENSFGLTLINWWSLLETKLDSYPVKAVGEGNEGYEQEIDFNGMTLHLLYQESFLDYLKDEYVLGKPIYLYLQIGQIDGFKKKYICHVRDFSLVPPEEIVEKRIEALREAKREK